jgi:hypothetical protein
MPPKAKSKKTSKKASKKASKKESKKKVSKPKKIYCGAGEVPSGHRRGTMMECIEKNQVRYYGVKKVDSRLLSKLRSKRDIEKERDKLVLKTKGYKHKIVALRKKFFDKKTPRETKLKLKEEILELNELYKKYHEKFKKIDARHKSLRT